MSETFFNPELLDSASRYAVTLFGATIMYAFSLHARFSGAREFIVKVAPHRSSVYYERMNAVIVIGAGSAIGFIVFAPTGLPECLAAGFGWVGALNVLMKTAAEPRDDEVD